MKQCFVRVHVMEVLPSGQKRLAILANGADGIRFCTDDKSIVEAPVHLLQAQRNGGCWYCRVQWVPRST